MQKSCCPPPRAKPLLASASMPMGMLQLLHELHMPACRIPCQGVDPQMLRQVQLCDACALVYIPLLALLQAR